MSADDKELESLEAALLEVSAKYTVAQMTVRALRERWYELQNQTESVRRRSKRLPEMARPLQIMHFERVTDEDIRQSDLRLEADVSGNAAPHLRSLAAPEDLRHAEIQ